MIHKFKCNGYYLALDVASGSVYVLDELSYELLDYLTPPLSEVCPEPAIQALKGSYAAQDILESYQELYQLYKEERLFVEENFEQYANVLATSPIKSMCLNVAHDCNLRCSYCFASTGDFGTGRKLMPEEIGKKALDFLVKHSKGRHNLEVDFFGGEPLMNFEVVKKLVAYGRSLEKTYDKTFRFTITTNGMLLDDDKIDFINREMSNVVLSIDGRKEVTDHVRKRVDGSGCYDTILPKFQRLVEKREYQNYYARGTFTKYNLDFSEDVDSLFAQGFDQISIEPVVGDPACEYSIHEQDLPIIFAEYEKLAQKLIAYRKAGKQINFFHFMIDLDQGPCVIKRLKGCGCGNEYIAVTPDGDIFPCHQFVGNDQWKMGNVMDGSFDFSMKADFAEANIYHKPSCKECWAKFFCSGGCNANNAQYCGSIFKPHTLSCELEKKRLECAIMIKAAMAEE